MPRRSKRIRTATQSGGRFGNLPRAIVVHMLKYFDIHEVARLQRLVCREFRDAGQERIHERGGRKLYEEGRAFVFGEDHQIIDRQRGELLLQAARGAGCRTLDVQDRMYASNPSDEEKQKILKDLKQIATTSPYHWVDFYIGIWYEKGWSGEEDKKQAVVWYNKAKNSGNAGAINNLGVAYFHGNFGLTQSLTKANELYALAAEKGHTNARYNLGNDYRIGRGVNIDLNRCVELWEQSAKQGHANAQFALCNLYRDGSQDNENGNPMTIPKNHPLHFKWALAAAKQGHVGGQAYTAECYESGWGTERNFHFAFEWWIKAARQNDAIAERCLGQFFEHGKGRDIDLDQALFWYQKAEAQGDQLAADAVERINQLDF
jgi:TPR repeat protein